MSRDTTHGAGTMSTMSRKPWVPTVVLAVFSVSGCFLPQKAAAEPSGGADVLVLPPCSDLDELDRVRRELEGRLRSDDPVQRAVAAEELGFLLDCRAAQSLNSVLQDSDARVRHNAGRALENLRKYQQYTSLRPSHNFRIHPSPLHLSVSGALPRGKDVSGNEIEFALEIWENSTGKAARKIQNWLAGSQIAVVRIAGMYVDQRLPMGNLLYLLNPDEKSEKYTAAYYTPTCSLIHKWRTTDSQVVLDNGVVIDRIDLGNVAARVGPVGYRLIAGGKLLVARQSPASRTASALGEEWKDQSGGTVSARDWLLECRTSRLMTKAQFLPEIGVFRGGRVSFAALQVKGAEQPLGTIQVAGEGVRLLAYVDKRTPRSVPRSGVSQVVRIPEPTSLVTTNVEQERQVLKPSELLPTPTRAAIEVPKAPSLQTRALVREEETGIWSLIPQQDDDQIVIEAMIVPAENELTVRTVFGEGSVLRFDTEQWVTLHGTRYQAGGIRLTSQGNHFLDGTRRRAGQEIERLAGGNWQSVP